MVVETGLCKAHQERRGTVFNFSELFASIHMAGGAAEEALAFITRVAHQLRLEEQPLAGSPFWAQMKTQLPAEALVYAAAFAVEARLVFGDRPKSTTYRRLVSCPTLKELDETFAKQSARNYRLLVPEDHEAATLPPGTRRRTPSSASASTSGTPSSRTPSTRSKRCKARPAWSSRSWGRTTSPASSAGGKRWWRAAGNQGRRRRRSTRC